MLKLLLRSFCLLAVCSLAVWLGLTGPSWAGSPELLGLGLVPNNSSGLPKGNAITDGKAILRYALPINNPTIREVQRNLEDVANQIRGKRWSQIGQNVSRASRILSDRQAQILADIPDREQAKATEILENMQQGIAELQQATEAKNKEQIWLKRKEILNQVGALEEMMVKDFPYKVPEKYSNLPQLKGQATIAINTTKGDLTVVVDGYSAPVTAGNFVDLVQRGFYDGLEFTRAEDDFYIQTGDPAGPATGFVDPETGAERHIPLEILAAGDSEPTYEITLEDAGRYRDLPALPFSSFGALAMGHPEFDPNGGSSQIFFFLFEPELTPAGRNLLDGRYAVFGYVTEGKEVLEKIRAGDKIKSARVVRGAEKLI
jgi:peptidylprolyl isomerase